MKVAHGKPPTAHLVRVQACQNSKFSRLTVISTHSLLSQNFLEGRPLVSLSDHRTDSLSLLRTHPRRCDEGLHCIPSMHFIDTDNDIMRSL